VLVPNLTSKFPAWGLRYLAKRIPFEPMNSLVKISDKLCGEASRIWKEKKAMHARGEDPTVGSIGEGKDIMSILCAYFDPALGRANSPDCDAIQ
jgi:hypothetical protein